MPLTPAEVHNVAFKKPPIGKRGYDEEEVDAFLDVVEVELSRLIEENNDLRGGGGAVPVPPGDPVETGSDAAELAAAREQAKRLQTRVGELEAALSQGSDGAQQHLVALQHQLEQAHQQLADQRSELDAAQQALHDASTAQPVSDSPADTHAQAVQMLALAQQTADQHLASTKASAERLLSEAQSNATTTLNDAQTRSAQHVSEAEARAAQLDRDSASRAEQTVREADQRAATITAQFEQRKAALERRVEELRVYEREYRTRLRGYLESQLRDLDASGRTDGEPAEAQHG